MDQVLVGIDGSPDSLAALRWAHRFAAATGRQLVAAYAWQHGRRLEGALDVPHDDVEDLEEHASATLRRLVTDEVGDDGVVAECVVLRGPVTSALVGEASRRAAGLLVVGASGTGGARRLLLGSVSRALVECPTEAVAVVPRVEPEPDWSGRPLVVGVDGSDGSARALRWAAGSAARAGVEVVAVHAFEVPVPDATAHEQESLGVERQRRVDEEWCAPLRARGVAHRTVFGHGDARDLISSVADVEQPIAVVLGSRGLGAIAGRLLGSVTHHAVRELAWPTVVIPAPGDRTVWPSRPDVSQ